MDYVLFHGSVVVLRADLPIVHGEKVAHLVYLSCGDEHEVGMAGGAARESFGLGLAGFVSAVDEAGEIADVGTGKIADLADVESHSSLALEYFEVIGFELFDESCAVSQHWVHHFGFEWEGEQEEGQKAIGERLALGMRLLGGGEIREFEDVPEDGEEESPDEVAGSLDLLAA